MLTRKALYREVYRMIEVDLRAHEMHKHEQGIYGREITTDARGMVRLNVATKYGFEINPLIGVQYLPLEHVLAELKERPFHPTKCGDSITKAIGYLSPPYKFKTWSFEEGPDNATTVADMVHEITSVGFRYMEDNCTLERVCERLAVDHHFMMGNDVYQLPVGYMMLGRFDDAEKIVRNELARIAAHRRPTIEEHEAALGEKLDPRALKRLEELKDQPIPAHENYRRFAERFFRRLEEERKKAEHGK